jgi:hypothetical protein
VSRPAQRRRNRKPAAKPVELWRAVPDLDEPDPVSPAPDPTLLLRSLGPPPLPGQGAVAEHYLAAVAGEAARLAKPLALSADLLADPNADDDDA